MRECVLVCIFYGAIDGPLMLLLARGNYSTEHDIGLSHLQLVAIPWVIHAAPLHNVEKRANRGVYNGSQLSLHRFLPTLMGFMGIY